MKNFLVPNEVKFTISDIQVNITTHKKKQGNINLNKENYQPVKSLILILMLKLSDNDTETVIVTVFCLFKKLCRDIKDKQKQSKEDTDSLQFQPKSHQDLLQKLTGSF